MLYNLYTIYNVHINLCYIYVFISLPETKCRPIEEHMESL